MKPNFVVQNFLLKVFYQCSRSEDFRAFELEIFKLGIPNIFYKYVLRSPHLPPRCYVSAKEELRF